MFADMALSHIQTVCKYQLPGDVFFASFDPLKNLKHINNSIPTALELKSGDSLFSKILYDTSRSGDTSVERFDGNMQISTWPSHIYADISRWDGQRIQLL